MADNKEENKSADGASADKGGPSKKSKLFLIAGIGGVLVLCILVCVFFMLKSKSSEHVEVAQGEEGAEGAEHAADGAATDEHGAKEADAHGADPKQASDPQKEPAKDGAKAAETAKAGEAAKDGAKLEAKAEATKNFGETFMISKMELNLGNPMENRYVRLGIALEYRGGPDQGGELKQREAQIKDIIISSVTTKSRTQLLTENGKELLRREILNRVNEVFDKPIQNVFFTEFLVE